MFKKFISLLVVTIAILTVLFSNSAVSRAQSTDAPGRVPPIKRPNNRVTSTAPVRTAKGWDGKVQGAALSTTLEVTFNDPNDYKTFAAGILPLNIVLTNTVSGQKIGLYAKQVAGNLRTAPGGNNRLTIEVVIDNMSAPLNEAMCGEIKLGGAKAADGGGVNILLSYSLCGSASVTGEALAGIVIAATSDNNRMTAAVKAGDARWVIISGEKNAGNINILLGDSRLVPWDYVGDSARGGNTIILRSSKGTGSPKAAGF